MSKKVKTAKKKSSSPRAGKARAFFKRYWYWFVAIAVLIGVTIGWCAGMGLFTPDYSDEVPDEVSLLSFTYYIMPDKIGKFDAKYTVPEKYAETITVEENVIYAKKEGTAFLKVAYGKASASVRVEITRYESNWTVGVGDEFTLDQLYGLANSLQPDVTRFDNSDTTVLKSVDSHDGTVKKYVVAKQGLAVLTFSRDDEMVCLINLMAKDNVQDHEKNIETEKTLVRNKPFKTDPNVKEKKTLSIADKIDASQIKGLIGSGNVYFESSDSTVATVYQDGTIRAGMPGTAIVTVACVSEENITYYSIEYEVKVEKVNVFKYDTKTEETRNIRVGESFTEDELFKYFYKKNIHTLSIETQYDAFIVKEVVDGETRYRALKATGDRKACVTALSENGRQVAVYIIDIDEKAEE